MGYVEKTYIANDLSNIFKPSQENNIVFRDTPDAQDQIFFTNTPSAELSYDGVITDVKSIYQRVTGTIDDFFDVDFEDEEDEYDRNNQPVIPPKGHLLLEVLLVAGLELAWQLYVNSTMRT